MKIINKEQEKEIERLKQENKFLNSNLIKSYIKDDLAKLVVSILKTLNLNEIEIDNYLILSEETIEICETENHSRIIKLRSNI